MEEGRLISAYLTGRHILHIQGVVCVRAGLCFLLTMGTRPVRSRRKQQRTEIMRKRDWGTESTEAGKYREEFVSNLHQESFLTGVYQPSSGHLRPGNHWQTRVTDVS